MESTGWGYLWLRVWACALAWLSIDCHSEVVSWTGYSENCHLRIFSDRIFTEEYFFWIRTPLEISHFFTCVVFFNWLPYPIFPFQISFPLSPFPPPFSPLPVYHQHRYSFTCFIHMDQHPFIFRVEYDGRLLSLHLIIHKLTRTLFKTLFRICCVWTLRMNLGSFSRLWLVSTFFIFLLFVSPSTSLCGGSRKPSGWAGFIKPHDSVIPLWLQPTLIHSLLDNGQVGKHVSVILVCVLPLTAQQVYFDRIFCDR